MRRNIAFPLVITILLVGAIIGWRGWVHYAEQQALSDLRFTLTDGSTRSLAALGGRPALIAFWSPTCPPCLEELPAFAALYTELAPRGFEIIAVSMPYDPPGHIVEFVRSRNIPYPVALDLEGRAQRAFDVDLIPRSFLLGPDGRVLLDQTGVMNVVELRAVILDLLP